MSLLTRRILNLYPVIASRNFHQTSALNADKKEYSSFDKFYFEMRGYNKYGILEDDFLRETDPNVVEAIRRLPEDLQMKRLYRSIKAQHIFLQHKTLPKEEWSTINDDHNYLQPYLQEVLQEQEEREEWDATY